MAESAVSFLVERLGSLANEEIRLLSGVAQEINDIKKEFQFIKIRLRNADAKVDLDDGVKEWVKEVRQVAYEIEDLLDEYFLSCHHEVPEVRCIDFINYNFVKIKGFFERILSRHQEVAYEDPLDEYFLSRHQEVHEVPEVHCIDFINNIFVKIRGFFERLKSQHEIGNQIIDIKQRIENISKIKERYNLGNLEGASSSTAATLSKHDPRTDALFLEETDLVGTDGPRKKLIGYTCVANPKLVVVSILGEGGLGKTTVVKKVFDSHRVKRAFRYRAWLTISQTPDAKALLADLLKQLLPQLHKQLLPELHKQDTTIVKLQQQLKDNLRGKRYVVVLDDVWTVSDWKQFKNALPDDNESASRILVTTRKQEVADTCTKDRGHIYSLERLNSDQSWKLFYMKTCNSMNCYSEDYLRAQSEKFLKKCNGLPLAIVAIGGLLSRKRLIEWDQVYQTLGSLMDQPSSSPLGDLHMVISLSFNDLPYHLKSCFLYLSMFPEDYTINCSRLLRLWVAQGFVETKQETDESIEEIARSYLDELIQRSLIQATYINNRKKVVLCKIHDLVRYFIIGKARDQSFAEVVAWNSAGQLQQSRHLSIYKSYDANNIIFHKNNSRSLFIFSSWRGCDIGPNMFSSFRLLKVLDLGDAHVNKFPDGVVNLFYLRYLSLGHSYPAISSLLISVEKLVHLETLDLRGTRIQELPVTILKLKHLRNLLLGNFLLGDGMKLPIGIGCLVSLEKVGVVDGDYSPIEELGMLTRLRSLKVRFREVADDGKQLFASIERMKCLRTFKVICASTIDSHGLRSPPPYLRNLSMDGILSKLPDWFSLLENLEKLKLRNSELINDPFRVLQELPNLVTLQLYYQAFLGEELCISKDGFPRLKELHISWLPSLNNVKVEEGAMPVIQTIGFSKCRKLQNIPHGIHHLLTLQTITYKEMPRSFAVQLKDHQILLREKGVSLTITEFKEYSA